jgi:SAM-dependent methyltransferase
VEGCVARAVPQNTPIVPPVLPSAQDLAAYDQNSQTFRSLNQLFWQIPVIGMSLTGGLWFGVAKADASPWFQLGLLFIAGVGNFALIFVLFRLRYIIGEYISWLRNFHPSGFVVAAGNGKGSQQNLIRTAFQTMFGIASFLSFGLMAPSVVELVKRPSAKVRAMAFYDRAAQDLVDRYEALDFSQAHPYLVAKLTSPTPLRVLDVGAGSGRDAAAISGLGHQVWAIEPSDRMRSLGRAVHNSSSIRWLDASLPSLQVPALSGHQFDLIVLSAVLMHVPPKQRREALERLSDLLAPGGEIYLTLRLGPGEAERALFPIDRGEVSNLARSTGLEYRSLGDTADLLGRDGVTWQTAVLTKPK